MQSDRCVLARLWGSDTGDQEMVLKAERLNRKRGFPVTVTEGHQRAQLGLWRLTPGGILGGPMYVSGGVR